MAKSKNPEQRSATAGDSGAQPTGDEVYNPTPSAAGGAEPASEGGSAGGEPAPATSGYENLRDAAVELRRQATQLYRQSQAYAGGRPVPLLSGAFVAGLLVGLLTGRD